MFAALHPRASRSINRFLIPKRGCSSTTLETKAFVERHVLGLVGFPGIRGLVLVIRRQNSRRRGCQSPDPEDGGQQRESRDANLTFVESCRDQFPTHPRACISLLRGELPLPLFFRVVGGQPPFRTHADKHVVGVRR